ncbi:hypothetical protein OC834_007174, partial [Tilletia horrida]
MDSDADARQPSSGPQRRARTGRASLNVPASSSSGGDALGGSPSTPAKGPHSSSNATAGSSARGSPYARPTPSPNGAAAKESLPASASTPSLFTSLVRGALGTIGWGSSPSKKESDSKKNTHVPSKDTESVTNDAFASIGRSPAQTPTAASRAVPASSRLTTSRSLSQLGPGPRNTSASFAPSPLRGSSTAQGQVQAHAPPPSAWPGSSQPVGAARRSRSRGPSRDASPALTNVSAYIAVRRNPSIGASTSGRGGGGLYGQQQRPVSMISLSGTGGVHPTALSEFGGISTSSPRQG